jgi:uncharacterized protein involved in exopolysaccharide biosynthesis
LGLYASLQAKHNQSQIVAMMRKKISVDSTTSAPPARSLKSFNVSFSAPTPVVAAKVANRLASLFIEENLKVRGQQILGTADFFDRQLDKAKQDLDEKSQKLAQLRSRYAAELPESQNMHLQALTSAQLDLRGEQDAESRAEHQKTLLQALLAQSPNVVNLDTTGSTANTGLEEQLERLQGEMDQLRSRYGPSYPDVLSKAADIQNVEQKIKEMEKQGKTEAAVNAKGHNPAIEGQLAQLDEEIRKHQAREAELASQIKFHQAAMENGPAAQQAMAEATNDVAVTSDRYKHLEDRKFGADMFSDVESQQQAERFVLLDPAQPPERPSFPDRGLIDGIAVGAGFAISLVLVLLLEILDATVKTEREVRDQLKAPIFGEIPRLTTKSESRRRRWWNAVAATGNLVLALGYAELLHKALK